MVTVNDILQYMNTLAPASMKMDWDNVGLLCGSRSQQVHKIMVALDPFESVCKEAAQEGADLIVTHHPLIFRAPNALTDDTALGRSVLFLAQHGISSINAHTNLDCAPGGVNDVLAQALGLKNIQVINPTGITEDGQEWGLLRMGTVDAQNLQAFLCRVKTALGCQGLRYTDGGKQVYKVAVGGGACAGEMGMAIKAGCDTFVTADVRYNQFWDARESGINLIDAGHFHTENPICSVLAQKLQAQFPEITVTVSKNHQDCANFFM